MTFRQSLEAIRSHQRRGATTPERAVAFLVARYGVSEEFARYRIDAFCRNRGAEREQVRLGVREQMDAYLSQVSQASAPITWTNAPSRATITTSSGSSFQATLDTSCLRYYGVNGS